MELAADTLSPLRAFLAFLNSGPDGNAAARSCALLAGAPFQAAGARIDLERGGILEMVGSFGYRPDRTSEYQQIALDLPMPMTKSFNQAQLVSLPMRDLSDLYPIFRGPDGMSRFSDGPLHSEYLVCTPIHAGGIVIGVLTITHKLAINWVGQLKDHLDALAFSLGLWSGLAAAHSRSTSPRSSGTTSSDFLSQRQREILMLIALGLRNEQIGVQLGFSQATIKKEAQYLMKVLGATDRKTLVAVARETGLLT